MTHENKETSIIRWDSSNENLASLEPAWHWGRLHLLAMCFVVLLRRDDDHKIYSNGGEEDEKSGDGAEPTHPDALDGRQAGRSPDRRDGVPKEIVAGCPSRNQTSDKIPSGKTYYGQP